MPISLAFVAVDVEMGYRRGSRWRAQPDPEVGLELAIAHRARAPEADAAAEDSTESGTKYRERYVVLVMQCPAYKKTSPN